MLTIGLVFVGAERLSFVIAWMLKFIMLVLRT